MFGFGWFNLLPWSRARRHARARREIEQVMERSGVLARAVEDQVRQRRLIERQYVEAAERSAAWADARDAAQRGDAPAQPERRVGSGSSPLRVTPLTLAPAPRGTPPAPGSSWYGHSNDGGSDDGGSDD